MNPKYKSLLLLLTTLFIGIIIGMLVSGWMVKKRIQDMRSGIEVKKNFIERLEHQVDFSEEKWEQIRPIMEEHFERMGEIRKTMRYGIRLEKDSLHNALEQQLSEDEIDHIFQQMWRMGPAGRGKGPRRGGRDSRPPHGY
ncbi:MAG: hypothetical protein AAF587_09290 [Bacteroidota bacterium]